MPLITEAPQEVLLTRQRHEAKRAGLHYDYRIVIGDKAYSWATKKEMPKVGEAILLHEQPVHDLSYALSERVEIPEGQYGAGITTLDFVRKATLKPSNNPDQFTLHTKDERFLIKKLDNAKYGEKAWLMKNLGMDNKYLTKAAMLLTQIKHEETGKTKWLKEKDPLPKGWVHTKNKTYIRRKNPT